MIVSRLLKTRSCFGDGQRLFLASLLRHIKPACVDEFAFRSGDRGNPADAAVLCSGRISKLGMRPRDDFAARVVVVRVDLVEVASPGQLLRGDSQGWYPRLGRPSPVCCYFLVPVLEPMVPFWEAAAAIVFGFSFLGFFASRLPRCSPLAIACLR